MLLIGLIRGLMRGIIVQATSIGAVIVGVICARMWSTEVAAWLGQQFTWSEEVCQVAAVGVLFIGVVVALSIVAHFLTKIIKKIHLGFFNRICGALFGIIEWSVVALVFVWGIQKMDSKLHFIKPEIVQQSVIYPIAVEQATHAYRLINNEHTKQNNNNEHTKQ